MTTNFLSQQQRLWSHHQRQQSPPYNNLDNVRYNRQDYCYTSGYKNNNTRDGSQNNIIDDQQSNTQRMNINSVTSKTQQHIDRCVHEITRKLNCVCHTFIVPNTHTNIIYICSLSGLASKLKYINIQEYNV